MGISHRTYDTVMDNDWTAHPKVTLYGSVEWDEFIAFLRWCTQSTGPLRVQFLDGHYRIGLCITLRK